MQRFFVEPYQIEEEAHRIHINGTDVNHIKNVLRMKCGEDVWISDGGDKEYHCQIEELGEDEVLLHILYAQEPEYELPNKLYLFQGLPKADKMELIIQKAVELGAFSIIPVETKRCVVKLDVKKAAKKVVRWQQIAESAAKQSKRMPIPEIHEVMTYKQALEFAKQLDVKLIPYELAKGMKETREILSEIKPGQSVGIFIGPEGGLESTFMSPAMFDEFLLEPYKEIYGYYHSHGVELVIHHSDSYAATLVPSMIEMGIDVWQGCMETNNLPELIRKYGGKISFMGGIENRAVDFEGWTDENCDAVVRRVCEECGNKYFIPCIAQGGPGSVYPGVYKSLCDSIDKLNEEKFGIKASESTRLPWQIMF